MLSTVNRIHDLPGLSFAASISNSLTSEVQPMFSEIVRSGVRWKDGRPEKIDVILWCTGFRSSLDHLMLLLSREVTGGIAMTGRLATMVAKDPRIHLVGYGPSASTIGANRAGRSAAEELTTYLGGWKCYPQNIDIRSGVSYRNG